MFSQGIPLTAFEVTDIASEFARLMQKGVAFTLQPTPAGAVTMRRLCRHLREFDSVVPANIGGQVTTGCEQR